MQLDITFFTKLGYTEDQAKHFCETLDVSMGTDIAFYRNLGYSLIESEYLALNVFNEVASAVAPEKLGVPNNFLRLGTNTVKTKKATKSIVSQASIVERIFEDSSDDALDIGNVDIDDCYGVFGQCTVSENSDLEEYSEDSEDSEEYSEDSFELAQSEIEVHMESNALAISTNRDKTHTEYLNTTQDESNFKDALASPTSTFRATVNTASFNYIKDSIKNHRQIYGDAIRTEEVINYLDYTFGNKLNAEVMNFKDKDYMLIGIKGDEVTDLKQNIVVLLDTSGSMGGSEVVLQKIIMTVAKQLKTEDTISLVTYSERDKLIFEGLNGNSISDIILSLSKIEVGGCTAGSTGLDKAYTIAEKYFIENASNRVIIITDGDFNFGTYDKSGLRQFIKKKKETGVFLTVLGVSDCEIYNEEIMEVLARDGNGNYFRVSDEEDILEVCKDRFVNNTVATAKDVKIQIEFNPAVVEKYKLIGYETRQLSHEDFKNDSVTSETLGNNQVVVALYQLIYKGDKETEVRNPFKYQEMAFTNSTDICTVQLNYKGTRKNDTESITETLEVRDANSTYNICKAIAAKYFVDYIKTKDKANLKAFKKIVLDIEDKKLDNMQQLLDILSK